MGVKMMRVGDAPYLRQAGVLPDRERMVAYEAADVTIAPASSDLLARVGARELRGRHAGSRQRAQRRRRRALQQGQRRAVLREPRRVRGVPEAARVGRAAAAEAGQQRPPVHRGTLPLGRRSSCAWRDCSGASVLGSRWSLSVGVVVRAPLAGFDANDPRLTTNGELTPASARVAERVFAGPSAVSPARAVRPLPPRVDLVALDHLVQRRRLDLQQLGGRFCTPPAASSVDSMSRRSTLVMTSLSDSPSGGTTKFGMRNVGAERM